MSLTTCQPMALCELEDEVGWRATCLCGWRSVFTYEDRATALLKAYAHDRNNSDN